MYTQLPGACQDVFDWGGPIYAGVAWIMCSRSHDTIALIYHFSFTLIANMCHTVSYIPVSIFLNHITFV